MQPIGRQPRAPARDDDPLEMMLTCHQRIREHVTLAARLPGASAAGGEAIVDAAARLARYFTVGLPLHATDEELLLRPRLERAGDDPEIARAVTAMAAEHVPIHAAAEALVPAWEAVAGEPGRLVELATSLAAGAARLAELLEPHLAVEERLIFPLIDTRIDAAGRAALAREMRERRGR
jgi:hemerythrin-like domain-containing protein